MPNSATFQCQESSLNEDFLIIHKNKYILGNKGKDLRSTNYEILNLTGKKNNNIISENQFTPPRSSKEKRE
jgi:hypothetical protein